MITQEKMYEVLFDNKEYVCFIISQLFIKAEPNEKTYETMLDNNVYFKYLCSLNPALKQDEQNMLQTLKKFENKFWLKKDDYAFVLMLKEIKRKNLNIFDCATIIPHNKLINGFYEYLEQLSKQTGIPEKKLYHAATCYEATGIEGAICYLIKHNLIK